MHKRTRFVRFGFAAAAGVAGLFAIPINWSSPQNGGLITQAQARIGNPLTPGSIAGAGRRVERRTARRAYRGAYYGAGAAIGATGAYLGSQYYNSYPGQFYGRYPGRYYGSYASQNYGAYPGQYSGTNSGQYYGAYARQNYGASPDRNYGGSAFSDGSYTYSGLTEATEIASWCASQSTGAFLGDDGKRHPCRQRPTM
jgi:hypothetical protein